jgi:hypothetical protein
MEGLGWLLCWQMTTSEPHTRDPDVEGAMQELRQSASGWAAIFFSQAPEERLDGISRSVGEFLLSGGVDANGRCGAG